MLASEMYSRPRVAVLAAGALGVATGGLQACSPPDVATRTENYLAAVQPLVAPAEAPRTYAHDRRLLPRLRERRLDVRDERIGMLDFLSIQGCRLGELAGYRNSPLGRTMVGTRRLVYETEVLAAGEPCLAAIDDESRRLELSRVIDRKQRELPRHVWNAVWTDSALASSLSSEVAPRPGDWESFGIGALSQLRASLEHVVRAEDALALESALGQMRGAAPAGGLLRALDRVGHGLDAIAVLVERVEAVHCGDTARRLARVFQRTYPGLQPELAQLDRRGRQVIEAVHDVYSLSRTGTRPPDPMAHYARSVLDLEAEDALWSRYRRAVKRHAAAWEPVLRRCGALPAA